MTARQLLAATLGAPYVITDATLRPDRGHLTIARDALAGGARIIQLRDKKLPAASLAAIAREIASMAHAVGGLLIVNDVPEAALASDTDGIHVGRSDLPVWAARATLGPDAIIGASVDTVDQALAAQLDGADYLGVGPIFATSTKHDAGEPIGLGHLSEIRAAVNIPVVAIGGLTAENVGQVLAAGADGAAFISAVVCADDMQSATRAIAEAMAPFRKDTQS